MNRCSKIHHSLNVEINRLLVKHAKKGGSLLDVGCWDGSTTLTYAKSLSAKSIFGIEGMVAPAQKARESGLTVVEVDIESQAWKLPVASIDTVVCNQVFEHLKNIFLPYDEIASVLAPGGTLIISVPNLASFHNRVMLALGMQPSSIRIWGPHVRGYALQEFVSFLEFGGIFQIIEIYGVGFYPLSPNTGGNIIANIWKSACHTPIFVLRRSAVTHTGDFVRHYSELETQTLM